MAAANEPVRIDPETLNALHEGTLTQLIGARFVEATKDRLVAELTVRNDLTTVGGRVHGGTLMTLADLVGATGTFLNLPPGATGTTTRESKTNFFAGAREGILRAEGMPIHRGRTTQVWQTRVTDASGRLLSMTIQTQLVLRD